MNQTYDINCKEGYSKKHLVSSQSSSFPNLIHNAFSHIPPTVKSRTSGEDVCNHVLVPVVSVLGN